MQFYWANQRSAVRQCNNGFKVMQCQDVIKSCGWITIPDRFPHQWQCRAMFQSALPTSPTMAMTCNAFPTMTMSRSGCRAYIGTSKLWGEAHTMQHSAIYQVAIPMHVSHSCKVGLERANKNHSGKWAAVMLSYCMVCINGIEQTKLSSVKRILKCLKPSCTGLGEGRAHLTHLKDSTDFFWLFAV